jgi:hypothetical protein
MLQGPNWQSSADNVYLNDLTAWEFLRRNPEYIRDYQIRERSAKRALKPPRLNPLLDVGVTISRSSPTGSR